MLKSQKHYYWIGGAIWGVLLLAGVVLVVAGSLRENGASWTEALETETFAQSGVITGLPEEQGVVVIDAGMVDIGPAGLTLTDPVAEPDRPPFELDVPEGRFEALIYQPVDAPRVIGMVGLRFSDATVSRWEKAGRKSHPLDFEFGTDEWVALGDAEAVAALDAEAVRPVLEQSTGPLRYGTIRAEGRDVLLFDPSFETFSADVYAGFAEDGTLVMVVKDYGYFGTRDAFDKPAADTE